MPEMTNLLTFDGYWRAPHIAGLPATSGIYGVYAGAYAAHTNTVSLRRLLYVGQAGNVRDRVAGHERWSDWAQLLLAGEELCFSAALIAPAGTRQRAEAAMIHHHKPPCNVEHVSAFPYDETTVLTAGTNALMSPVFTVQRTPGDTLATLIAAMSRRQF